MLTATAQPMMPQSQLFRSFWQAGFESATHRNGQRQRVDMVAATQHVEHAAADYALLREQGILTAREGVRWPMVETGGAFDFSSLVPLLEAARRHGIQIMWTLCHYGWPDDLDVFAPAFVVRFARYCGAAARFIAAANDDVPFYSPINEISFLSFAAGQVGWFHPYAHERGDELKAQLVRAAIAGIEAIWAVDPRVRIVHVDPVINVVPCRRRPFRNADAARDHASQFAAWDWLAGRARPELGGHPRYLDIVGANYYSDNQWECSGKRLRWDVSPRDPRWVPLHRLLAAVYNRYRRPLFIGETSHVGAGRGPWLREIAAEVAVARSQGVPVEGICLYPIIDRPDWENPTHWHNSGLWDLLPGVNGRLERVLVPEYAAALADARAIVPRETRFVPESQSLS